MKFYVFIIVQILQRSCEIGLFLTKYMIYDENRIGNVREMTQ